MVFGLSCWRKNPALDLGSKSDSKGVVIAPAPGITHGYGRKQVLTRQRQHLLYLLIRSESPERAAMRAVLPVWYWRVLAALWLTNTAGLSCRAQNELTLIRPGAR
jgi:hypothetical protein